MKKKQKVEEIYERHDISCKHHVENVISCGKQFIMLDIVYIGIVSMKLHGFI